MHTARIDPGDIRLVFDRDRAKHLADGIGDLAGGFLAFAKRENRGAGPGNGKSKRPGGKGRAFGPIEFRNEFLTARFGDDVVDGAGNKAVIFLDQAAKKSAEIADLLGGVLKWDFLG